MVDFQNHVVVRVAAVAWSDKWTVLVLLELTGEGLVVGNELKFWVKRFNFIDASVKAEEVRAARRPYACAQSFVIGWPRTIPSPVHWS
jgi:hypothetical protein